VKYRTEDEDSYEEYMENIPNFKAAEQNVVKKFNFLKYFLEPI